MKINAYDFLINNFSINCFGLFVCKDGAIAIKLKCT